MIHGVKQPPPVREGILLVVEAERIVVELKIGAFLKVVKPILIGWL